jgi:hypothetical protein
MPEPSAAPLVLTPELIQPLEAFGAQVARAVSLPVTIDPASQVRHAGIARP